MKTVKCKINLELARKINKFSKNSNDIFFVIGSKFCKKCFDQLKLDIDFAFQKDEIKPTNTGVTSSKVKSEPIHFTF